MGYRAARSARAQALGPEGQAGPAPRGCFPVAPEAAAPAVLGSQGLGVFSGFSGLRSRWGKGFQGGGTQEG